MRKLIEASRRKPDIDLETCTPIRLSDGQEWYFSQPWFEVRPVFRQGKCETYSRMLTLVDLDPLLEAIAQEEEGLQQAMQILTLGALLLQRLYDVDDSELGRLFILRPGNPETDRMLREIVDIATGHGITALGWRILFDPKVFAAG